MVLTDQLFHQFSDLVYRECGINLHEGKKALLQARLNKRLRITGFSSYEQYYEHITSSGNCQEFIHFLDSISTNLTYFFRESQHFEFLEQKLPEVLEAKRKEKNLKLRIWSAGCSTGEEPYSIAMCVLPHLEGLPRFRFPDPGHGHLHARSENRHEGSVFGGEDCEGPGSVAHAPFPKPPNSKWETGIRSDPIRSAPDYLRTFESQGPLSFQRPLRFHLLPQCHDLLRQEDPGSTCPKIAHYLDPGGYLFVGHSESLMGLSHSLRYVRPAVYRK